MSDLDQAHEAVRQWYRSLAGYQRLLAGLQPQGEDEEVPSLPIIEFTAADHEGQPLRICVDLNRLSATHRPPVVVGLISLLVEDYGQCLDKIITTFTTLENQHLARTTAPTSEPSTAGGPATLPATPPTPPTTAGGPSSTNAALATPRDLAT